jgi:hypothetical protein
VAEDVLSFAGIAPPILRLYPLETHIAEKLHAYTMPRSRPSSRVKDLPDIALLATAQILDAKRLREALEQTFTFRETHFSTRKTPSSASRMGDTLRRDGPRRSAGMAHSRRRRESGSRISWPRARRESECDLAARGLGVATSLTPPSSRAPSAPPDPWPPSRPRVPAGSADRLSTFCERADPGPGGGWTPGPRPGSVVKEPASPPPSSLLAGPCLRGGGIILHGRHKKSIGLREALEISGC